MTCGPAANGADLSDQRLAPARNSYRPLLAFRTRQKSVAEIRRPRREERRHHLITGCPPSALGGCVPLPGAGAGEKVSAAAEDVSSRSAGRRRSMAANPTWFPHTWHIAAVRSRFRSSFGLHPAGAPGSPEKTSVFDVGYGPESAPATVRGSRSLTQALILARDCRHEARDSDPPLQMRLRSPRGWPSHG